MSKVKADKGQIDSIALEVQWNRLISIMDEVDTALVRTSFSTIVGETRDFACILMNREGQSLAQSQLSSPAFTVMLPRTTKYILSEYGSENMEPGDVFLQNDPWVGTGHLPDLSIIMPIFYNDEHVGFIATAAHVADIGGRMDFFDARDLFEEGLRIPVCKIYKAGVPNEEILRIIRANVRVPDLVVGDIHAIIGAEEIGAQRLKAFFDEYSIEQFEYLGRQILERSERSMRKALSELPDGTYDYTLTADGYKEPVKIQVAITIKDDTMHVDYEGSSPQFSDASVNCVENATFADTTYPLKCSLTPFIPNNEGLYKPITFSAPRGSVLNTTFPSPVKSRSKTSFNIHMAIYGALAKAMPGKVQAGSGSFWALTAQGVDQNGEPVNMHILPNGGKGALQGVEGQPTIAFPYNGTVTPAEIVENSVPLLVKRKELITDSGGAGEYQGGLGQEIVFQSVGDYPVYMALRPDKVKNPPPGIMGGEPGMAGSFTINGKSQGDDPVPPVPFNKGDELLIRLPGGGGYGRPERRSPEKVARDVADGIVSKEKAYEVYKVSILEDGSVDEEGTARLRGLNG